MSATRSRPGSPAVRKTKEVGPDYPETNFRNPFNAGIVSAVDDDESKTLRSPSDTIEGCGIPLRHEYGKLWEGK